ncbi:hypothetical protein JVT61DRAFT_9149 [Boletus reticuloceps]|uniref:FAD-binding PCMH-type domain-containing protein n=1 Tax=Boletus reticuloceps TaxID=495285 RepID=A0A8I2YGT0_9AGAM|nr:hypothetical protein JVT61DRAFT_9149 [Boletus reticuloceps]
MFGSGFDSTSHPLLVSKYPTNPRRIVKGQQIREARTGIILTNTISTPVASALFATPNHATLHPGREILLGLPERNFWKAAPDIASLGCMLSNYKSDVAREGFASALLWPNWESCSYDNGCALNCSDPQPVCGVACHQGTTSPFSIAISSAQDASNVIKWATANNVKLTIQNTGSSTTRVPALTIGAGAQLSSIYEVAGQQNVSAVLGACPTVGVAGGYLQAGGHAV